MNVITAYLYDILDTDIYMKIPKEFKLTDAKLKCMFSRKLKRNIYGLKQSRQIWYNRLSEYILKTNMLTILFIFIKKSNFGFVVLTIMLMI